MINCKIKLFKKKILLLHTVLLFSVGLNAQLSGPKAIPADYPTIAAFVIDLNAQGVGVGGVTLTVPAGYTETAPAGGYIITASGTVTDPIIITGDGALPLPLITASPALTIGNLNDAIFVLHGADVVTIQGLEMQENPANNITAAATNNMTEWGIALLYVSVTDGAQFNSIIDNTISLDRFYQNTFGIYSNSTHTLSSVTVTVTATGPTGGNSGLVVHGNTISDVNNGIVVVGPTGAADHNDGIDIGGTLLSEGNTITNYGTTGTFSAYANVSGTVYGVLVRNSKNFNISNNTITSSVGGTTAGTLRGIFIPAFSNAPTGTFSNAINENTLNVISGNPTGAVDGIAVQGTSATATSSLSIDGNLFNGLGHSVPSTGVMIFISAISPAQSVSVSTNSFSSLGCITSGSVTFISTNYTMPAAGTQNVNNNQLVGGFNKMTAGGTLTVYTTNSSSPAGSSHTSTFNDFSGITVTGATFLSGWLNTDGGSTTKTITNNTFSNWTGGTNAVLVISQNFGGDGCSVSNNAISNITGQAAITGINFGTSNSGAVQSCFNNTISGLSSTAIGGTVIGITNSTNSVTAFNISGNTISNLSTTGNASSCTGITSAATNGVNISGNTIFTLSASGTTPSINGIVTTGGAGTFNVFKNKIYSLNASGAATNTAVNGLAFNGGLNVNAYNNVISGLTAPLASSVNAINGILVNSTTALSTYRIYYNSVYINATSGGLNFGTTAISHTVSATPTTGNLDLRNNILINESVANGTGFVVAYRRSGTSLNNYAMTSNRNLFFAGIPSPTNLIFTDGTTPQMTFPGFQVAVATRELNSFTGEAFVYSTPGSFFISLTGSSSDFLRPVPGITTQVESGGEQILVPAITDDYSGIVRSVSTPDIGAHEFVGISPAPVITLNSITPGTTSLCTTTARLVSVNVTTVSGTITGATLYYSFNGAPQSPISMVNTAGTTWEATIPMATPVNAIVSWSVVADNSIPLSTAYVGTSYFDEPLFGFVATATSTPANICDGATSTVSVVLSNPAAPAVYVVPPAVTFPTTDEDLGNVTITQGATVVINNFSPINNLTGTIGVASGTVGSYSNFTAFGPYDMTPGLTYDFSLSSLQAGTAYNNSMAIYIDYNRNGVYTDPGEQAYAASALTLGAHTETGSFVVPLTAASGSTRMRVICNETTLITSPTQVVAYGEYEEYAINILPVMTLVTWSDGVGPVGMGSSLVVTPAGTTTYSAEITSAGCVFAPDPTTIVNIDALPSAPTANNSVQCGTQIPTASVTSTTGAITPTMNWYDAPTAGTLLQSSTSITYTSLVSATTTFYVSELDAVTGCESLRIPVTVTVSTADGVAAVASFSTICLGDNVDLTASNTNPFPVQSYTYSWDGAAGSGAEITLVGSTVTVTPSLAGTYTYDLTAVDGSCTALAQVVVTVEAFDVSVTGIDITCNGLMDGTFSIGLATCGTMPYTYSVDGGPFGALPTNLAAGSYNIVVLDDNGYATAGQIITIIEPTTIVGTPSGSDIIICQDDLSALVVATATTSDQVPGTLIVTFDLLGQPIETNAAPGNIAATATYTLPIGATVTGGVLDYDGLTAISASWMSDIRLGFSGAVVNAAAAGTGSTGAPGTFNYTRVIPGAAISPAGGSVNLLYWDFVDDNVGVEAIFPTGSGVATLTINYTTPAPANVSWWDASTGGTQLGLGSPFETVGTSVLPNTTTPGMYTVYAQGQEGPCGSAARIPININILPSSYSSITVSQCDPYTLNSTTYSTTGMFTQTLVNMIGCDSIITLDLTILPTSSSTTVVTACDTYDWTDGNTYVIGGIYTDTLINSLGCDSIATLDLTLGTTPISSAIDNGDGTITASSGVTFEWMDCTTGLIIPGETSQTYVVTANGSYAAIVYSLAICSDTTACIDINYIGIEESTNAAFKVYPNPTHDQVTISMNANVSMVEVFDAQGKLLDVVTVENGGQLDLSNFNRGVYYLRIKTDTDSSLHRIVKQ